MMRRAWQRGETEVCGGRAAVGLRSAVGGAPGHDDLRAPRISAFARATLAALGIALGACAGPPSREVVNGWREAAPLASASDLDPAPRIVEVDLVAAPHRWMVGSRGAIDGFAYNGTIPGPLLEARVGDTLVVHFRNDLDEATTIHWHGVRVPHEMDGAPHSQDPVPPGGTFEYRFVLEDAGTFWYHPHQNEPEQMERGLYGAIVVRADDEPTVDGEAVLVLDDLLLAADGTLAPFGGLLEVHGGREGDVQLVNGVEAPVVPVRSGARLRWRIVNAGSARIYRLTLAGHRFTVLGSDGGAWSRPQVVDALVLAPGDRMDVVVDVMADPGARVSLVAEEYERGHGQGVFAPVTVATLETSEAPPLEVLSPLERTRTIEALDGEASPARTITFDERLDTTSGTLSFFVNGESYPDVTPVPARVGVTQVWDLVNMSEMTHPFHLHGFFFQVVERDGRPVSDRTWEDTIELVGMERVRIAFLPDDRPGMWMFHCHILEHVHAGMMGMMELGR